MAANPVRRRIRFAAWANYPDRPAFDVAAAAEALQNLPDADWRLQDRDMTTAVQVDRPGSGDQPLCLRYFRLREGDDVPHKIDGQRALTAVEIEADEAITDWTHAVIWRDGYAAHDPHRDAPTLARLSWYIRNRADQLVRFVSLYDRNLIDQLRALDDVRIVEIRINRPDAIDDQQAQNYGMLGGLLQLARGSETATLESKLSVGRSKKRHLAPEVREDVIRLAESASDLLDHLVVTGTQDGHSVSIDMLKQRIEEVHSIPRSAPRILQPSSDAVYDTIIAMRERLDTAGSLEAAARAELA